MKKQGNGTMTQSEESIMLMTAYSLSTIARAHSISIRNFVLYHQLYVVFY